MLKVKPTNTPLRLAKHRRGLAGQDLVKEAKDASDGVEIYLELQEDAVRASMIKEFRSATNSTVSTAPTTPAPEDVQILIDKFD